MKFSVLKSLYSPPMIVFLSLIFISSPILEFLNQPFIANTIFMCLLYAIMAMAWNLLAGYTGYLSFGHAAFFGLGAYTTMILMLYYDITPWIGIWFGGLLTALSALALGFPLFRLRSHWFALATIAVAETFKLVFIVWPYVGAAYGLQSPIVAPEKSLWYIQYAGPFIYIYIALIIFVIELTILYLIITSRTGYYLMAIREDEDVSKTIGINTLKYKMFSLMVSAFFTGIAGGVYVIRFRFIDPFTVFNLITISIYTAVGGIIGGVYSFIGPIIGSFVFIPLTEYVRVFIVARLPEYYGLHFFSVGILLLVISLLYPAGITGYLERKGYLKKRILPVKVE